MSDSAHDVAPRPPAPPARPSGLRVLVILTLVMLGIAGAAIGGVWWALSRTPAGEVSSGTWAHVRLEGEIADAPPEPGPFDDPSTAKPSPVEIAAALRAAATDDRIDGLFLDLGMFGASAAVVQELRDAVVDFTASGKPCVAYASDAFTNWSYQLATACPTVGMSPAAAALIDGLRFEVTYYKGTFDKIGVNPQMEHVGDFKSAVEAFERTGPSEPAAEAYEALVGSLYDQLVAGIAAGRDVPEDTVRGWIDRPTMSPRGLLDRGMVDMLAWPDVVEAFVHRIPEEGVAVLEGAVAPGDEPSLTPIKELVKDLRAGWRKGPAVAVVHAAGNIVSGDSEPSLFGDDGSLTDGEMVRWLEQIREDDRVKAVVLRVDSPGGSATAASHMRAAILRLKEAGKPVVVSMAGFAASGGYLISADADHIVAQPTTLTGSIGVFGGKVDLSGMYDKLGITTHAFQRGDAAGVLSLSSGFDPVQREAYRAFLTDFYALFIGWVAKGRGMSVEAVDAVAQGRVWTGTQALDRGLVDALGGLDVAIAKAAELADITDPAIAVWPPRRTFFERLMEELERGNASAVAGAFLPARLRADLSLLEQASRAQAPLAWWPGAPVVR